MMMLSLEDHWGTGVKKLSLAIVKTSRYEEAARFWGESREAFKRAGDADVFQERFGILIQLYLKKAKLMKLLREQKVMK